MSPENISRIREFATGSDYLFIEAMFLQEDEKRAQEKYPLSARQDVSLAWQAGVARVIPFHLSTKYTGQGDELRREAEDAFQGQEE